MKKVATAVSTIALIVLFIDLKFLNPQLNRYVLNGSADFPVVEASVAVFCIAAIVIIWLIAGIAAIVKRFVHTRCPHCGTWQEKGSDYCPTAERSFDSLTRGPHGRTCHGSFFCYTAYVARCRVFIMIEIRSEYVLLSRMSYSVQARQKRVRFVVGKNG